MLMCPECADKAVPEEYQILAKKLFPAGIYPEGKGPSIESAGAFAEILGIRADYAQCTEVYRNGGTPEEFLISFQNNLALLIQKTWVEKADEGRKEDLLDRLPSFIEEIKKGAYCRALEEFGVVLEELAYLLFGAQSGKDDFTEYTFRIDAQMGLFWWYGGRIGSRHFLEWAKTADQNVLAAVLLLGICYLTNF